MTPTLSRRRLLATAGASAMLLAGCADATKNPNIKTFIHNKAGALGIIKPNFLHPPFNDPKARQALMHAIDQTDYMSAAIGSDAFQEAPVASIMGSVAKHVFLVTDASRLEAQGASWLTPDDRLAG